MSTTYRAWRAGFTRRWHSNHDLSDTVDYDAGHQGRVAVLILNLFPGASRNLLIRALTHDQGEVAVGDVSYEAKRKNPVLAQMVRQQEAQEIAAQGLPQPELSTGEKVALKLCDSLDAWLWMMRHRAILMTRREWLAQLDLIQHQAKLLGVAEQVSALTVAAVEAAL